MKWVLRLENSSKKRIEFLRYDIGMTSEFLSAKMERVLAGLRVQSYNTKKRIPNFLANLWYFEMSKSAHSPSVYWEKIFFVSQWRTDFKMSFDAKIKFLFGSPFPWLPVRVSIHLRLASDDSPIFLRYFFDHSSIAERRMNGEWTENERSSNGERYGKYTIGIIGQTAIRFHCWWFFRS